MSDEVQAAYERHSRVQRLLDDARRALVAVLADPDAARRVSPNLQTAARLLADSFERESARIVRVWD